MCMPHTIRSLKDASGTHTLNQCTIQPLSDPILLWSMRYRQLMFDAFLGQVRGEFSGDIFASVVRAEGFDHQREAIITERGNKFQLHVATPLGILASTILCPLLTYKNFYRRNQNTVTTQRLTRALTKSIW